MTFESFPIPTENLVLHQVHCERMQKRRQEMKKADHTVGTKMDTLGTNSRGLGTILECVYSEGNVVSFRTMYYMSA